MRLALALPGTLHTFAVRLVALAGAFCNFGMGAGALGSFGGEVRMCGLPAALPPSVLRPLLRPLLRLVLRLVLMPCNPNLCLRSHLQSTLAVVVLKGEDADQQRWKNAEDLPHGEGSVLTNRFGVLSRRLLEHGAHATLLLQYQYPDSHTKISMLHWHQLSRLCRPSTANACVASSPQQALVTGWALRKLRRTELFLNQYDAKKPCFSTRKYSQLSSGVVTISQWQQQGLNTACCSTQDVRSKEADKDAHLLRANTTQVQPAIARRSLLGGT